MLHLPGEGVVFTKFLKGVKDRPPKVHVDGINHTSIEILRLHTGMPKTISKN